MRPFGLSLGALVALVRETQAGRRPAGQLLVVGPLAAHLARSLAEGGEASLVRTTGPASTAAAFVCVLGGAPKPEQLTLLREATRAGVPTVAVQTGDAGAPVPYVLPGDVVLCRPGEGFPVDDIAAALVRGLGRDVAPLAAQLPVLRPSAERELALRAAGTAASLAATGRSQALLPVLVPMQVRLLGDLRIASGRQPPVTQQELGMTLGQQLGVTLGVGLAARTLVRRAPLRNRLLNAVVAGTATYALALAGRRR